MKRSVVPPFRFDTQEHEDLCERCGVSCHAAAPVGARQVVIEHLTCIHYGTAPDGKPGCTVYADRFTKAPWCMHTRVARFAGALRVGCPYGVEGQPGKVRVSPEEYDKLWPQILQGILETPSVNLNFTWKKFLLEANRREPDSRLRLELNATKTAGRLRKRRKTMLDRVRDLLPLGSSLHK